MHLLSRARRPKRVLAAVGATALILVLAGCGSPGAIGANSTGFSDGVPGDVVNFSFVCSTVTSPKGNCGGQGMGTINGTSFTTLTASGATFENTNGDECKKAPCPKNAYLKVWGQAQYGNQQVTYHFRGTDPDLSPADSFQVRLDPNAMTGFSGSISTFHCNGCVEVVMSPGHIPDSVYNNQ